MMLPILSMASGLPTVSAADPKGRLCRTTVPSPQARDGATAGLIQADGNIGCRSGLS